MKNKRLSYFIILLLSIILNINVVYADDDVVTIVGDLFDQRTDGNIFYGTISKPSTFFDNMVESSLDSNGNPRFVVYDFYNTSLPSFTDRWFNDYGYNPLVNIKSSCDSIINNDLIDIDLKIWAYKTMYLSLSAAKAVSPETITLFNDFKLLTNNADYIYSLNRVDKLLQLINNNLSDDINYYDDISVLSNEHTLIFASYINPENLNSPYYRANSIVFPNSISVDNTDSGIRNMYNELVNNIDNKNMIEDNTTRFFMNIRKDYSIDLVLNDDNMYEYNSNNFFIADNYGIGQDYSEELGINHFWSSYGVSHNYLFSYKFTLDFYPKSGTVFKFSGDDDVWAFLSEVDDPENSFIVINLGGIHSEYNQSFKFEANNDNTLSVYNTSINSDSYLSTPVNDGIDPTKVYRLYLFFSERMPSGSNFSIVTDIDIMNSDAPILSNNNLTMDKNSRSIILPINNHDVSGRYRIYNELNDVETSDEITINNENNMIVLSLNNDLTSSADYYLSLQNSNKKESERIKFTLNPYVEPQIIEDNPEVIEDNPETLDIIVYYVIISLMMVVFMFIIGKRIIMKYN